MICGNRLKIGSTVFQELAMTKSSSDELKWTVNIPSSYRLSNCIQLRFTGIDLSNNSLGNIPIALASA